MKKTLRNIISTALVLNMLVFAIGCTNPGANTGKDNNDSQAQLVNGPSTVNPGGSSGNNNGNNGSLPWQRNIRLLPNCFSTSVSSKDSKRHSSHAPLFCVSLSVARSSM